MKNKNMVIIVAVILIVVAAVGGFFGGMQYQKSQSRTAFAGAGFGGGNGGAYRQFAGGQNGQNNNFRAVRGQVLSLSNGTMTVKLNNGSTEIVVLSGSTTFAQAAKASLSDVKTGDTVNVVGSSNSDGSVTAQDVQINPVGIQRPAGSPGASQ